MKSDWNQQGLELLLNRHSCHRLQQPGPSDEELQVLLQAALRAPDFGHLRPFRFLAARGAGLDRLGAAMHQAALAAGKDEKTLARTLKMPHRAPLLITVVARPKPHPGIPVFDQQLSAASALLLMQLAARAMGYDSIWRSGWLMYDATFHQALNLTEQDQIVGFLYLGTALPHEPAPRPAEAPLDYLTWL